MPKALLPLLAAVLIVLGIHLCSTQREAADCNAIYHAIIQPHEHDNGWLRTHVLLNRTDSMTLIRSDIPSLLSRTPFWKRIRVWWEFHSFSANNRGGQPLKLQAPLPGLLVISPNEVTGFIGKGVTVLTISYPGFSFDHEAAIVFVTAEIPSSRRMAPFFQGYLLYVERVHGHWIIDQHPGLPGLALIT